MTIPHQVHNVLQQVAREITLNQNNGQMRWFQGTSRVNVFENDTFYCVVAQSVKFQTYERTHFRFLHSAYLPILAGGLVDQNSNLPVF